MKHRRRHADESIHDVNMTPLIDVSLVLVVILMVATPLAFQSSFGVQMGRPDARRAASETRDDRVMVTVHEDATLTVNRQRLADVDAAEAMGEALRGSASRIVIVRCESRVPHNRFVWALDEARLRGASAIAVVGS